MKQSSLFSVTPIVKSITLMITGFLCGTWHFTQINPMKLPLPARAATAVTGSQFLRDTNGLSLDAREDAVALEILKGNVPSHLRTYKEIQTSITTADGMIHNLRYRALPDYLAIGSNDDFIRIPMNLNTALKIADHLYASLPTTQLVNNIYMAADFHFKPSPLPASKAMIWNPYFARHQEMIENQRIKAQASLDLLLAGHKKDVVISKRLWEKKDKIAIFGWHRTDGEPIQPLSIAHRIGYADYSHGIRLIDRQVNIDGNEYDLLNVLTDPQLAYVVNAEGPLPDLIAFIDDHAKVLNQSMANLSH